MDPVWDQIGQSGPLGIAVALCLGIGLAAATGLRAFLPLLLVACFSRFQLFGVDFGQGFDWLESDIALIALLVAVVAELVMDKVPALDSAADVAMTAVRPALAAVLVMASFSGADPALAPLLAMIAAPVALLGHGAKAIARPFVTVSTGGAGNPVVSFLEDGWALVLTGLALLMPLLIPLALVLSIFVAWRVLGALGRRLGGLNRSVESRLGIFGRFAEARMRKAGRPGESQTPDS